MIAEIFTTITTAITNFASAVGSAITSVAAMFYDPAANSGAGEITFLGTLLLIGVGCAVVYWGFRLIKGLIGRRMA